MKEMTLRVIETPDQYVVEYRYNNALMDMYVYRTFEELSEAEQELLRVAVSFDFWKRKEEEL